MKNLLSISLLAVFCTAAYAQDLSSHNPRRKNVPQKPQSRTKAFSKIDKLYLSFGTHTEFYNQVQTDDSGSTRKFDWAPTIGAGLSIPIASEFHFIPEMNWVLPLLKGDSKIIQNLFMFRGDVGYLPVDWFRLRVGTSVMVLNQHGRGGSDQVNNGSGTSTFYYPNENRSSINNTLDVGGEFILNNWALRLQTYTYSLMREERRQISYTMFVTYYWDRTK